MILPDGRYAKVTHLRLYQQAIREQEDHSWFWDSWEEKEKRPYSVYRKGLVPLSRGGKTIVQVLDRYDGEHVVAEGFAYCNPSDNYNKKLGREIALGRAMKQLGKEANERGGT